MNAPLTRMAARVLRSLVKQALGALGALAIIGGLLVAIADTWGGLAIVGTGAGLICVCWGLSGRQRRAPMPAADGPALSAPPGESLRPPVLPSEIPAPRAA